MHVHETECAVRQAVDKGQMSSQRYESYKRVRATLENDDIRG